MPSITDTVAGALPGFLQPGSVGNRQRENLLQDDKFRRSFLYFFELTVPATALEEPSDGSDAVSMLFPLVINPQSIAMSEPYTVNVTPTSNGGLFVEENGILARSIKIEGHTGFAPKPNRSKGGAKIKVEAPSFKIRGNDFAGAVSGQRHFQFLQDRVFRTYGDLKRDPRTAKGTILAFHNPKDDEHWRVVPIKFDMHRAGPKDRFLYRYSIELLAVDMAERAELLVESEDKNWLDKARDLINDIKGAVAVIVGAIQEIQAFVKEIEGFVTGIINLVGEIANIINAVSDFVDGVVSLITAPFKAIANVIRAIDGAITRLVALPDRIRDSVRNAFHDVLDSMHIIGSHRRAFQVPAGAQLDALNNSRKIGTSTSQAELNAAAANPAKTATQYASLGTAPRSGDRARAANDRSPSARSVTFQSTVEHVLTSTDTLEALAARFLGDARQWRLIAQLNGLQAPYVSALGLPNTLRLGDRLSIPSTARPTTIQPGASILGTSPTDSTEDRLLGRDLRLVPIVGTKDRYDFEVDPASNGTDIRHVSGIENLQQALRTRMITEQGTNVLYRRLGIRRLVGIGIPNIDDEIVKFRFREAITADPRIARVTDVRLVSGTSLDVVDVDLDAQVRGFNAPVSVHLSIA